MQHDTSGNPYDSPLDNQTYNLLQILVSKLEAVEAYNVYLEDMSGEADRVLSEIAADDRRHVDRLVQLLGMSKSDKTAR
jgi:hypothetical protein